MDVKEIKGRHLPSLASLEVTKKIASLSVSRSLSLSLSLIGGYQKPLLKF